MTKQTVQAEGKSHPCFKSGVDSSPTPLPSSGQTQDETPVAREKLPFQPAPGESNEAFEAFLCYLDLTGKRRTCLRVSQLMAHEHTTVKNWSKRYKWTERIAAYNRALLRERLAIESKIRREHAQAWANRTTAFKEEEWRAGWELLKLARKYIEAMNQAEIGKLSPGEVARVLEIASKIGRLATGLATDKQEHTGADGGPIRIEVQAALKRVYGQPLPGEIVDAEEVLADRPMATIPEKSEEAGLEKGCA